MDERPTNIGETGVPNTSNGKPGRERERERERERANETPRERLNVCGGTSNSRRRRKDRGGGRTRV